MGTPVPLFVWLWWLWIVLAGHQWLVVWVIATLDSQPFRAQLPKWKDNLACMITFVVILSAGILSLMALGTTLAVFLKGFISL